MNRFFIEVAYRGTSYSGFQIQENASSIQGEVEKALATVLRIRISLTGSSRTDTGVHAFQNYFHFDFPDDLDEKLIYNLNAVLPRDIAVKSIRKPRQLGKELPHCRFDALSREYKYFVYGFKDPFLEDRAYYYPYPLDMPSIEMAAEIVLGEHDFTSFSKKNTQVKTFTCKIFQSEWKYGEMGIYYHVKANRFLRGMVRALVGTMLQVGRGKVTVEAFAEMVEAKRSNEVDFSAPAYGLFLIGVEYPKNLFC